MILKTRILELETGGKPIVVLNRDDAEELGVKGMSRLRLQNDKKEVTAIVNVTTRFVSRGFAGVSEKIKNALDIKEGSEVDVEVAKFPTSLQHIKSKLGGRKLSQEDIFEIVKDVVEGNLSEVETAAFVTALETRGFDLDEAAAMSMAMVETGKQLKLERKVIVDKHSCGGVPGDKTTLLIVPIVAAAGLTIPKTSSRAITSAAGTADKAEVFMPVGLDIDEMKDVVEKTNGCFVWGGASDLAPADDIFIQIEYPLSIDPLMLPSIMSKKKAVGANFVVIDIPTGRGAKLKTIGDANLLAKDFIELGRKIGIKVNCAITYGEQVIGHTVGPALEAREALEVLMRRRNSADIIDKAVHIAGMIFEMVGKQNGEKLALDILKSGKAEQKFREIAMMQGGDYEIKPEEIQIGEYGLDINAERDGLVLWIDNKSIVDLAIAAGSPKNKGAGILLHKKLGEAVKKDERLFTIYAEKPRKLERVRKILDETKAVGVGSRMEMLIGKVKDSALHKKTFMLER